MISFVFVAVDCWWANQLSYERVWLITLVQMGKQKKLLLRLALAKGILHTQTFLHTHTYNILYAPIE